MHIKSPFKAYECEKTRGARFKTQMFNETWTVETITRAGSVSKICTQVKVLVKIQT